MFYILLIGILTLSAASKEFILSDVGLSDEDNLTIFDPEEFKIQVDMILESSRKGHYIGNKEFSGYSNILRFTSTLDTSAMRYKLFGYNSFVKYNKHRLELENELTARITVINNFLQTTMLSERCQEFYERQKKHLTSGYTQFNDVKAYKIELYKPDCSDDENNSDFSVEDFDD